jgi:hypothetical protein
MLHDDSLAFEMTMDFSVFLSQELSFNPSCTNPTNSSCHHDLTQIVLFAFAAEKRCLAKKNKFLSI